jgi:hypothetical protein
LRFAIPTADLILRLLVGDGFPAYLAIEPQVVAAVFQSTSKQDREDFYGEFLNQLKTWQDQALMQQMRFSFSLTWPPRLQSAIDQYKSSQSNPTQRT